MVFNLKIELGNAAMQTGEDVAEALRRVASQVGEFAELGLDEENGGECGGIRDTNGNRVGRWAVMS